VAAVTIIGIRTPEDVLRVVEPTREVVELIEDSERVLYIVEPVAVPDLGGGSGGGGLRGYAQTAALTTPITGAGLTGNWTLTPAGWRLTVPAVTGEVLDWSPSIHLGGGPAALDLAVVVAGVAARYLSTGTDTPSALGSMYVQGDFGTVRLPSQRLLVEEDDVVSATVTLALVYRATGSGDTTTLGHVDAPSRITLANLGVVPV
jgi:hypothetical protein